LIEPEKIEEVIIEPLEEPISELFEENKTIAEEISVAKEKVAEQTEVFEPIIDPIEEEKEPDVTEEFIPETEQPETSYWSVETGWTKPVEENKEPEAIEPEPVSIEQPKINTELEEKLIPTEKKPIFESVSKPERSLNEMMANNKEKSVINEAQKLAFTDFKSAITLNLKISFIRELFQGNEKDYKKMIDFLTKCENFSEAKLYMQGEKEKHPEWIGKQDLLNHLQELINRKFL